MNFPVPWRALLPVDAVQEVAGPNGSGLRQISDATGAGVDISKDGETPASLSDKICTISGSIEQKEAACRRIVDKLRTLQEVADQEPGVFVIIVPSNAAPVVVGSRGVQIKEVIELSGAEISVGKENILGMVDQPIGITGTGGQVVSAVSKINAILQDLADRGRLQPSDFKWRPGAQASSLGPSSGDYGGGGGGRSAPPSGGNPRTHAKFVVATQVAGWIIGKQGRHIRELQENSGSHIQVLREGDVPPGVSPTDRIVELGGRFEAKAEGIQIILMAIDSMPALQAPRETQMLIPKALSTPSEVQDVQQMSGAELEVRDLPGHDESLCTLLGSIEARVKAAQQFLKRLEESMQDGSAMHGAGDSAPSRPVLTPPPMTRVEPSREAAPARAQPEPSREAASARVQPQRQEPDAWSAPAPVPERPQENGDPWSRGDPWSGGKPTVPPAVRETAAGGGSIGKSVSFKDKELDDSPHHEPKALRRPEEREEQRRPGNDFEGAGASALGGPRQPNGADGGRAADVPRGAEAPSARAGFEPQQCSGTGGGAGANKPPPVGGMSFSPSGTQQLTGAAGGAQTSFAPSGAGGGSMSFAPGGSGAGGAARTPFAPGGGCGSQTSFAPGGGGCSMHTSFVPGTQTPDAQRQPSSTSFAPSFPNTPASASGNSFAPSGMGMTGGMGGFGSGMLGSGMMGGMDMMGMMGGMGGEAVLRQALAMNNHGPQSQLTILLPQVTIQQALIPLGYFSDIAAKCSIRIDLGSDVAPNLRQVALHGTVAANAMAAFYLQQVCLQLGSGVNGFGK